MNLESPLRWVTTLFPWKILVFVPARSISSAARKSIPQWYLLCHGLTCHFISVLVLLERQSKTITGFIWRVNSGINSVGRGIFYQLKLSALLLWAYIMQLFWIVKKEKEGYTGKYGNYLFTAGILLHVNIWNINVCLQSVWQSSWWLMCKLKLAYWQWVLECTLHMLSCRTRCVHVHKWSQKPRILWFDLDSSSFYWFTWRWKKKKPKKTKN